MEKTKYLCMDIEVISKHTQLKELVPTKGTLTMLNEDQFLFIVEPNDQ